MHVVISLIVSLKGGAHAYQGHRHNFKSGGEGGL